MIIPRERALIMSDFRGWGQKEIKLPLSNFSFTVLPHIVSALEQFPPLNSFCTSMYCDQRSQCIRLNSKKKNSFRGNYSRNYGNWIWWRFSYSPTCFDLLIVDGATSADETLIAEFNLFYYNQSRALKICFFYWNDFKLCIPMNKYPIIQNLNY